MKITKSLKVSIDVFSIVFIVTLIIMIINASSFYYRLYNINGNLGAWAQKSISDFTINYILVIAKNMFLIIGIFFLRKVIKAILVKQYFSIEVTRNLERTGLPIIFTGIISLIMTIKLILNSINISGKSYDLNIFQVESLWGFFLIIIGLAFILISEIFTEARELKSENELTI